MTVARPLALPLLWLAALAMLWPVLSGAQVLELTPDTACGAPGVGTVREISTWTQIAQVLSTQSDGGQQQFFTYQLLEADAEKRIPTTKSAGGLTIRIADDPTLAGYIAASAANDDRLPRALRITMPNGSVLLYNTYVSLNKTPTFTVNQAMECEVTFSFLAEPVRYAA